MGIVSYDPDAVINFIPEYGGNREDERPCVIGFHFVPYAKIVEYGKLYARRAESIKDPQKLSALNSAIKRKQFLDNVVSVSGVFDGSRRITDVAEFYDIAPHELILEIQGAMQSSIKVTAGLSKITSPGPC